MALVGHISGSRQTNSVIGISGSVIIASRPDATFPAMPGTDVVFFVSGSINGSGSTDRKALFGGDLSFSGSLVQAQGNIVTGSYSTVLGRNNIVVNNYVTAIGAGNIAADIFSVLVSVDTGLNQLTVHDGSQFQVGDEVAYVYEVADFDSTRPFGSRPLIHRTKITNISTNVLTVEAAVDLDTTNGTMYHEPICKWYGYYGYTESVLFCLSRKKDEITFGHVSGIYSVAMGSGSYAHGYQTFASGAWSHAEGYGTWAEDQGSHAEGVFTIAKYYSHAEGYETNAIGVASHAEGYLTTGSGGFSHAEGNSTTALGDASHAEGNQTVASGSYSHAGGLYTIASGSAQTVIGKYNLRNNDFSLFVVGNGTADGNANRSDVFRVNQDSVQVTGSFVQANSGTLSVSTVGFMGNEAGTAATKGTDVFFYASGTIGSRNSAIRGTSLFGGDVVVSGTLAAAGDSLEVTGTLIVTNGISGSLTRLSNGTSYMIAGQNVTILSNSNGSVTISSKEFDDFFDSTTAGSIFTTGSAAFRGGESAIDSPSDKGTDVFFYVSGSRGSRSSNIPGTSLFGGDMVVSGSFFTLADVVEITGSLTVTAGISGSLTRLPNGTSYMIAGQNITILSNSNGSVTISSKEFDDFFDSTTVGSIFTTGSAAFRGGESAIDSPADKGTDVFFYVSGSINGIGSNDKKALFGGDVRISGSIIQGTNIFITGSIVNAFGSGTFAIGDYGHTEGTATFVAGIYSAILNTNLVDNALEVTDASVFSIGDKVAYVYKASNNNNFVHVTQVSAINLVTNAVTASSVVSIDSSATNALVPGPAYNYVGATIEPPITGLSTLINVSRTNENKSFAHAEGSYTIAAGINSHAEGRKTVATGSHSHAEGAYTYAFGLASHAEGIYTRATGHRSHAEGENTIAEGTASHAEGALTLASGIDSHAEGFQTHAGGGSSHSEGVTTRALGQHSHAEGAVTIAAGDGSHAEGYYTVASGTYSHAQGEYTIASGSHQSVMGKYNLRNNDFSFFVIGNGTGDTDDLRSDIIRVNSGSFQVTGSFIQANSGSSTVGFMGNEVGTAATKGTDVFFYVSGSGGTKDTTVKGVALFGGDVVISGTLYGGSPLKIGTSLQITGTLDISGSYPLLSPAMSGSLTRLTDGTSYLIAGSGITITSASNGSITIAGNVGDITSITAGVGLLGGGSVGDISLDINDSVVATISGSTFTGAVNFNAGLSGSLTSLIDGTSYLIAGTNISISSASNGSITISNTFVQTDDYFDSTTNGSIFTTGSTAFRGSESGVDSPADKGTDVFFYVSGSAGTPDGKSVFGGDVIVSGSLSLGSGSNLPTGIVYLDGGNPGSVTVTNSLVTANSMIFLTKQANTNILAGPPVVSAKSAGSFTITTNFNGDADPVAYLIINPA